MLGSSERNLAAIGIGTTLAAMLLATCVRAAEPAPAAGDFQPGDISIGEPIPLPFPASGESPGVPAPPLPPHSSPTGGQAGDANRRGSGWLGITVAESSTPGRWAVDRVAPKSPALAAGILPGDEIRAIDGMPLRNSDEVAQALTAIAPGQQVLLAIARGDQLADVAVKAVDRPSVPATPIPATEIEAASAPAATLAAVADSPVPAAAVGEVPSPRAAPLDPGPAMSAPPAVNPFAAAPSPAPPVGDSVAATTSPAGTASVVAQPPAAFEPLPVRDSRPALPAPAGRLALGVRTVPVDPGLQQRFRLPDASGAYVVGVVHDLPASRAGLPPGSVIVALDDRPVRSPEELTRLVTGGSAERPVPVEYVLPGGTARRAEVVLQSLERPLEEALVGPATRPDAGGDATTSRRPVTPPDAGSTAAIRDELRWLRARIAALERRLEDAESGRGGP